MGVGFQIQACIQHQDITSLQLGGLRGHQPHAACHNVLPEAQLWNWRSALITCVLRANMLTCNTPLRVLIMLAWLTVPTYSPAGASMLFSSCQARAAYSMHMRLHNTAKP